MIQFLPPHSSVVIQFFFKYLYVMSFKILHTADWHLGKLLNEHSLEEDQNYFIEQVFDELNKAKKSGAPYDAMVIAGDIYDTVNPGEKSMRMMDKFYYDVHKKFPELHLFVLKGNHDSLRIGYNKAFLDLHNIHLCSDAENFTEPFEIKKEKETLCVYQLPYLNQLNANQICEISSEGKLHSQMELADSACKQILESHRKNHKDCLSLLCAHLTTFGSIKSAYDEHAVGTIDDVDSSVFEEFNYTALGHIHKFQKCGSKGCVYYSGSPFPYYFDSSNDTFFICADISKDKTEISKIPLKQLHKVERIEMNLCDILEADEKFINDHKNNYIEIIFDDEYFPVDAVSKIKDLLPLSLSFRRKERSHVCDDSKKSAEFRESAFDSPEKYFDAFFEDVCGGEIIDKDLHEESKRLFIEIADRIENGMEAEE